MQIHSRFPRYTDFEPQVPVWCVTPGKGGAFHRFFDTSPFNPSGTLMAFLRMPAEDRQPRPGETAEVLVVDLAEGTERVVAATAGWECQMGANIAWADDETLVFNNVDTETWTPCAVRLNVSSGEAKRLDGTIYHLSPDGTKALSSDMGAMRRTQAGYGVLLPDEKVRRNIGLTDDDGLFLTDTRSGERRMVISLKEVMERTTTPEQRKEYAQQEVYGFHSKWNPQGDRLLFTVRRFPVDHPHRFNALHRKACTFDVYTMREDGSELFNAVPACEWKKGGHHINWFPDGETLSMNLNIDQTVLRFVQARYDGNEYGTILKNTVGSGHPTVHPNGRHILTDTYVHETLAFGDGTTPIRLVDRETEEVRNLIRMQTETPTQRLHPELRVDPHPAWDHSNRYIAFNGFAGGTRRVYVADLSGVL